MIFNATPENLSELDLIQHLAACTITQEMLDNTYPWAQAWIDQHLTIHFRAHYQDLEVERHEHIRQYREPQLTAKFREWWSPSAEDTHRIRVLLYYE